MREELERKDAIRIWSLKTMMFLGTFGCFFVVFLFRRDFLFANLGYIRGFVSRRSMLDPVFANGAKTMIEQEELSRRGQLHGMVSNGQGEGQLVLLVRPAKQGNA